MNEEVAGTADTAAIVTTGSGTGADPFGDRPKGLSVLQEQQSPWWCSLVPQNDSERNAILKALQQPDENVQETLNTPFVVANVLVQVVPILDEESGEIEDAAKVVLISPDGRSRGCWAKSILRAFQNLSALYGRPPWVPALTVTIRARSRNNRTTYYLEAERPDVVDAKPKQVKK